MKRILLFFIVFLFLLETPASAYEIYRTEKLDLQAGFWGQAWYQTISDGRDTDGDGRQDSGIYDTMIRRAYLYAKARYADRISLFAHLAGDRLGQDYIHNRPSLGLGANMVFRDAWITLNLLEKRIRIQAGRMYVPLTRNYGTTSTKSLLNLDLNWSQGGVRGSIFYPSRVGRDDGVCLWGNILEKKLQYRFMAAKGVYDDNVNPGDHPRFAGRISWAFFEPETTWFNKGTYLGKKRILSVGAGADLQNDLYLKTGKKNYSAYTFDVHYDDRPFGPENGAVTAEAAFIRINNGPNSLSYTHFVSGSDASIYSLKTGYLLPWKPVYGSLQPSVHFECIDPVGADATYIFGGGVNYFFKGQANKISFDITGVEQGKQSYGGRPVQDHLIATFQLALGF